MRPYWKRKAEGLDADGLRRLAMHIARVGSRIGHRPPQRIHRAVYHDVIELETRADMLAQQGGVGR